MMKHTGPKKLQMRPSFSDSQQLASPEKENRVSESVSQWVGRNDEGQDSLILSAVSIRPGGGRQHHNEQRRPVAGEEEVTQADGGVEDQDHHTVELHPLQQHPAEDTQEEEVEHRGHEPAAGLQHQREGGARGGEK